MALPLSITSIIDNGRYEDKLGDGDDFMHYKYEGENPNHYSNVGLRDLMVSATPLVYFHQVMKGKYIACWPVTIIHDNVENLSFTVALDDKQRIRMEGELGEVGVFYERKYRTAQFKVRLHQRAFRERVLSAYTSQCAICKLRHTQLLDAAHIIGDTKDGGEPIVQNGISLCKIHHAAYDNNFLGVRPEDYKVVVRKDILLERDGPMLKYGLQEVNDIKLILPKQRKLYPDRERLAFRFEEFKHIA